MTLVWGDPLHPPGAGQRTHAFIVGVGRYRHLFGGVAPTQGIPALGQLTSPPISARALAEWFIKGRLADAPAPLGSVELLLSDRTGQNFADTQVADATSQNIHTAFGQWKVRCDANPNNVAVFYFCGHGLQKHVMSLLPEDFAVSKDNLWKDTIDFSTTYNGMARCKAGTQLFIIDACRELSQAAIMDEDFGGTALISPRLGEHNLRTAPMLFGTKVGLQAFGDRNGVSRLTEALIDCLEGLGATEAGANWVIDTQHLGTNVQRLVKHQNEVQKIPEQHRQVVVPDGESANGPQSLRVFPAGSLPNVIVKLGCIPDSIEQEVTFFADPDQGPRRPAPGKGPWITKLPAGRYVFGCSFDLPEGHIAVPAPRAYVIPPVYDTPINVPRPHPVINVPPPPQV
ncbi:caspase family protein (plasmid) [Bradyrhizobium barranii subsp. apii]|uniref:Caspase family protein n=1 Tax=Bradyrhizobium barranii subsp. apii TaxID=2819348 RepID=A0A8T5VSJ0_9BRAD|nr:caspase family protein [Bradyrhizobium barranii]UPT92467.1 caspase family protein [Bradyrhizobium barranii subsp. apii]